MREQQTSFATPASNTGTDKQQLSAAVVNLIQNDIPVRKAILNLILSCPHIVHQF